MLLLIKTLKTPRNFFLLSNLSYKKRLNKISNKTFLNKRKTNFIKINNFRKFNDEKQLSKNWNIIKILQDVKNDNISVYKNKHQNFSKVFLLKHTDIYLTLNKELILHELEKNRQLFFFLKEFYLSLKNTNILLLKEITLSNLSKQTVFDKKKMFVYSNYITYIFCNKKTSLSYLNTRSYIYLTFLTFISNLLLTENLNSLLKNRSKILINKKLFYISMFLDQNYTFWEKLSLINKKSKILFKTNLIKKQKVISLIKKRTFSNKLNKVYVSGVLLKNSKNLSIKNFIWKRKNNFLSLNTPDKISKISNLFNTKFDLSKRKSSFQLLYLISRLEDKIQFYGKSVLVNKLIVLRNLLLYLVSEKKERSIKNNYIISKRNYIYSLRKNKWTFKFLMVLNYALKKNSKNLKYCTFTKILLKKLKHLKRKTSNLNLFIKPKSKVYAENKSLFLRKHFFERLNLFKKTRLISKEKKQILSIKNWTQKRLNIRRTWIGKKTILAEKYIPLAQNKFILSSWIGRSVDIIFINTLSLSKYAFKTERLTSPNNNPNKFLSVLDRDFINKYKYIGIYIKDLVRVAFISMFLKKPTFLAKFVAFQISKLPKNRKETVFIRFLIKVIKTFAAERKEILGVRIKFKGRVNRWRRTKFIVGNRGTLPLQTISERIEQGTAQAVNRKGALGIRIWLRYKVSFGHTLKRHILNYMQYSKILHFRRLRRNLLLK